MTKEELVKLKNPLIFDFINRYNRMEPGEFALKFSGVKDLPVRAVAGQIKYKQKAGVKFPSLNGKNIIYQKKSFEQSSGEITAGYKKLLLSGKCCIDITGGMGIDTIFISEKFNEYYYCEIDELTCEIFRYNINVIIPENKIAINNVDSILYLKRFPNASFDWIYADPDRRSEGRRSVDLKYCKPDIPGNMVLFRTKTRKMLIKLSPAFDFTEAVRVFPDLEVFVVLSVENECREVLLILNFESQTEYVMKKAVMFKAGGMKIIESGENERIDKKIGGCGKYLYEPDTAILKTGLAGKLALELDLVFVNSEVDFLTGENVIPGFPGRVFHIITVLEYKPDRIKKYFTQNNIEKANITKRGFPLTTEEFRKKIKLKDGGDDYIFLTKDYSGSLIIIHCRKVL
jgi:hypothetical protein